MPGGRCSTDETEKYSVTSTAVDVLPARTNPRKGLILRNGVDESDGSLAHFTFNGPATTDSMPICPGEVVVLDNPPRNALSIISSGTSTVWVEEWV